MLALALVLFIVGQVQDVRPEPFPVLLLPGVAPLEERNEVLVPGFEYFADGFSTCFHCDLTSYVNFSGAEFE